MSNYQKELVLIGAGKLGRGYLADLFGAAGYHLIFLEYSKELVDAMNAQGYYTLFRSNAQGDYDKIIFRDYEAYCTQTEYETCVNRLSHANFACMATYADGFRDIGYLLGDAAKKRMAEGNAETLDLFIAANWISPDQTVRDYMLERAENDTQKQFMQQKIGLIQTLPYRGGYPPTAEMLAEDPIAVAATDYPELPVDQEAFRGPVPEGVPFLMLDRMTERLNCKLWTANVRGAMSASFAKKKGYELVNEANGDAQVQQWAALGHREAIFGALKHFGFTEEELHRGMRKEDPQAAKRTTSDTLNRQLNHLKRKLGRNDRLVGPALACLEGGRIPFFLSRAIAYAFDFDNPDDSDAQEVLAFVRERGIARAVETYCQLNLQVPLERALYGLILAQYYADRNLQTRDLQQLEYWKKCGRLSCCIFSLVKEKTIPYNKNKRGFEIRIIE